VPCFDQRRWQGGVPELLLLWPKHSMQLPSWYVIFISFTFVLC
jgi:hypothetical protein